MISEFLGSIQYQSSVIALEHETDLRLAREKLHHRHYIKNVKKAIYEGDWSEVERLVLKQPFKNYRSFLYAAYKQAYLELLEKQEYQKVWFDLL
jgi:hypothetical protein